jgi:hypothetical protein
MLLIYGSTGYTGRLIVAEALAALVRSGPPGPSEAERERGVYWHPVPAEGP